MSICIEHVDVQELGDSSLADFDRRVASLPQDLSAPFHEQAGQLEVEVLGIYKMVALFVRREEDLDKIAVLWGGMVQVCDKAAIRLGALVEQHPLCGAEIYQNRLLDLRNKCQRLQNLHA